jgi:hypothetical protein
MLLLLLTRGWWLWVRLVSRADSRAAPVLLTAASPAV